MWKSTTDIDIISVRPRYRYYVCTSILISRYVRHILAWILSSRNTFSVFTSRPSLFSTPRWWFVSDLREQGLIKIQFVWKADNVSDIGNKNVNKESYDRLTLPLLMDRGEEGC